MRDPCLMRGPDGTFRLVWTTSWSGQTIGYAFSTNLLDWSAQHAISVMAHEPAALNCWAPEAIWDESRREFLIYWASTVTNQFTNTANQTENGYNHRFYCTATPDFNTFSPVRLFYDPGFAGIDATLLAASNRTYLIFKDERLKPEKKNLRIAVAATPGGPYGPPGPPFTPSWVEGPTALRLGDEYVVYYDRYREQRYGAVKSKDLVHWEEVSERLSMPPGVRHGTALAVPRRLLEPLLKD
jgi:hypothetical protein